MRARTTVLVAALSTVCVAAAVLGGEVLGLLVLAAVVVTWLGLYESVGS